MARQRVNQKATSASSPPSSSTNKSRPGAKGGAGQSSDRNNGDNHSSSSSTENKPHHRKDHNNRNQSNFVMSKWRLAFGSLCLVTACYFGYRGYLETRVNTPYDDQKMVQRGGLADPEMYWGSYRPGTYFGMKTRDPYSLVMGLMWYTPQRLGPGGSGFRHWCELDDRLSTYGWTKHDGRTFGVQRIRDGPIELETSFVKFPGGQFGGDWTARVSITGPSTEEVALLWYTATDEKTSGWISPTLSAPMTGVRGETPGLGEFQLRLTPGGNGTVLNHSYLSTVSPSLKQLLETVKQSLVRYDDPDAHRPFIALSGERLRGPTGEQQEPNFVATQIVVRPPFTLDIAFNSLSNTNLHDSEPDEPPTGATYTAALAAKVSEFDSRFESTFHLQEKGFNAEARQFAQLAFSNMVGSIGYFYGSSRVQSKYTKEPVPYWRAPLYTAVPSRSFFPRGFLWDEGFHGLLISTWDVDIQLDIVNHWFDMINIEGWIPREQILGVEALAKVPDEFVTQRNSNANPPTFFVLLRRLLTRTGLGVSGEGLRTKKRLENLERLFPRLQTWFSWYNTTQRGDTLGTYRWRGREADSLRELNPKTLTSGLDDYPRASHPTDQERHLDLRCWMAYAAGVMADLAKLLGQDESKYLETHLHLSDNNLLNQLHLSPFTETYSDFGLHTDSVVLKYPKQGQQPVGRMPQPTEKQRETLKSPELRFVDTTFGYVSLFPMLLEILTPSNAYLGKMLQQLRDPDKLWTPYGLRSLSRTSPLYMTRNTEHDPPYWRGQIWININYLAVKALHHYASQPGPYRELAKEIYVELRSNVVQNLVAEYNRTGYVWEQYNDKTGRGSGCHPFNGWSSLVVLMMSELY